MSATRFERTSCFPAHRTSIIGERRGPEPATGKCDIAFSSFLRTSIHLVDGDTGGAAVHHLDGGAALLPWAGRHHGVLTRS